MLAAAGWSLAYALELGSTDLATKIFWAKVQYFGIVTVAPTMLIAVLEYTGRDRLITRRNLALLAVIPILVLILVWTNEAHDQIWQSIELVTDGFYPILDLTHGALFWLIVVYSYLCLLAGTILLFRTYIRAPRLYRAQIGIMLLGTLVPWVANLLYVTDWNPFVYLDLTPFAFTITGLMAAWGMFRYELLDIVPVAHHVVIENMGDGVIVLDAQARILDINTVAKEYFNHPKADLVGEQVQRVLAGQPEWIPALLSVNEPHKELTLGEGETERHYDLRISPFSGREGELAGRVIVVRDTTTLKQTETALRESQQQLTNQNAELSKLSQAVEQSANMIIITDLEGDIEYVNPKFEEITGYTVGEIIGQNTSILSSGEHTSDFYHNLWHTIRSGKDWRGEFHNKRKDGTLYWEQATIAPIYNIVGDVTHFISVKEDITERKEAEQGLTKLLELSRILATTYDMDSALEKTITSAVEIVSAADRGTLQWLDSDGETLHTVAFSDSDDVPPKTPDFRSGVGIAGHALASQQLINVSDVLEDERFVPGDPSIQFRSLLVAPLIVKERSLGTLSLTSKQINAFSGTDETLIRLAADQTAAALQNAYEFTARRNAEETLHRHAERLQIRHEIDQAILAARLPETIALAAIGRIRKLIPAQRAIVLACEEDGQIRMLASQSTGEIGQMPSLEIYQELFDERTLNSGWVHGVENLDALTQLSPLQNALHTAGVGSYVVIPLFIQNELVGTLNLESDKARTFSADHVTIGTEVAALLAVAIRQARLYERAQQEIAERQQAEKALRQRTVALETQNAELDAFAHTVAHDLKNPLTTLLGYAELLEQNYARVSSEMMGNALHTIAQNAHKIGTIIDELLLLASVRETDKITTHPLEMGRIVTEARGRVLHLIEEYQAEIIAPETWPVAQGYGPWVEAIWANYISNALKYGGRPPRVELGAKVQEDGAIRFWVSDNGPGLSPQEQARLFTPFERLRQERAEGHGLGLSIVQRIAKKLDGRVGVESPATITHDGDNGHTEPGSTFYFTLPGLPTGDE
jgi:PAS domain S-box-containing protein